MEEGEARGGRGLDEDGGAAGGVDGAGRGGAGGEHGDVESEMTVILLFLWSLMLWNPVVYCL